MDMKRSRCLWAPKEPAEGQMPVKRTQPASACDTQASSREESSRRSVADDARGEGAQKQVRGGRKNHHHKGAAETAHSDVKGKPEGTASGKAGAAIFQKRVGNRQRNQENCHRRGTLGRSLRWGRCRQVLRRAWGIARPRGTAPNTAEAWLWRPDTWWQLDGGAPKSPLHVFYGVLKAKNRRARKHRLSRSSE